MSPADSQMPILEHLRELRRRMFIAAIAVVIGAVVGFVFRDWLLDLMVDPYEKATGQTGLAFFEVGEAFSVSMKVALFGGIVLSAPVWLYEIWAFITPALSKREKRWVIPIIISLVILFVGGVVFAYWTMERALDWLLGFGGDRLTPVIGVNRYLNFAFRYLLVFGVAFLFPVFVFTAGAVGAVGSKQLKKGRRWAVLIIVTVGAILTPTGDPLTLILLSTPLYLLYETTIWLVRFALKK
jgi:sec-independent protein translocase protein TatC